MGNRPFTLPTGKSSISAEVNDKVILKNRFSGKVLFRSYFYRLVTGDISMLETVNNKWFIDELLNYARVNCDIIFLPSLKRIASSTLFSESKRQQASEIMEIIEEKDLAAVRENSTPPKTEKEKIEYARRILNGARYPQTTEILRLLRDKSIVLKKMALYLIGKFKMSDMIPEVCECLNMPGLEEDAFSVIQSLGNDAGDELNRFFLASSGNLTTSKAVLRLFAMNCREQNLPFIVERLLWSNSRYLKELSLNELIKCHYRPNGDEKERLQLLLYELFDLMAWILSARESLLTAGDNVLLTEINKEYSRWKHFLMKLLVLTYEGSTGTGVIKMTTDKKDEVSMIMPDLVEIVFGDQVILKQNEAPDPGTEKKRLKKLKRYFPGEIPQYKVLLDDIINYDYNLIGVWTKACTIHNIQKVEDGDLCESITALLFSPDNLLREEAARLLFRSGKELYKMASERISEPDRTELNNIVSGKSDDNELIFEKVKFLSGCFAGIQEDQLISMAGKMLFIKSGQYDLLNDSPEFFLWTLPQDKQKGALFTHYEGDDISNILKNAGNMNTSFYVLPMNAVEEFRFQYPESSVTILEYIDKHEE